jgi:DNA repair exonuclease SbcCD ATPase subunit
VRGFKITDEQKMKALELYALGHTYRQIEAATGVKKSSMTGIVEEASRQDPDLQAMHRIAELCRKKGIAVESLLRGNVIGDRIEDAGSSLDEVVEKVIPLLKKAEGNVAKYAEAGLEMQKLVETTGETPGGLIAEYRDLTSEVQALKVESESLKERKGKLEDEESRAQAKLGNVAELETIQGSLKRIKRHPRDVAKILKRNEGLWERGLTEDVLDAIASEVQGQGGKGGEAAKKIADLVIKYGSLEAAVKAINNMVMTLNVHKTTLQHDIPLLERKAKSLQAQSDDLVTRVNEIEAQYNRMGDALKEREEAQSKRLEAMDREKERATTELQRLKEQAATASSQRADNQAAVDSLTAQRTLLQFTLKAVESDKKQAQDSLKVILDTHRKARENLSALQSQVAGLDNEAKSKMVRITELQKTVSDFLAQLQQLKGLVENVAEMMKKIQDAFGRNEDILTVVDLQNNPKNLRSLKAVLKPTLAYFESLRGYFVLHASEIPGSKEILDMTDKMMQLLAGAFRSGNP